MQSHDRVQSSLSPLALLGILAFGFSLMSKKWKKHSGGQQHSASSPKPTTDCKFDPSVFHGVPVQPTAEDKLWKTYQRKIWRKQISIAACLNWITAFAAGFAALYAFIAACQWYQANKHFAAQSRAWVGIMEPIANSVGLNQPSSIPSQQQGYNFTVDGQFKIKNFGPSPAFDVATVAALVPAELIDDKIAKNACISAKEQFDKGTKDTQAGKVEISKQDTTIFPNQDIPYPFTAATSVAKPTQSFPYVMVCIYYRDEFHQVHHTSQCLGAPWGGQPHPMSFCPWYNQAD